jgi:predicted outer membrane repeat protein
MSRWTDLFAPFEKWHGWLNRYFSRRRGRRLVTFRPELTALEERLAPAVLLVSSAADDGGNTTLRSRIAQADVNLYDTIQFTDDVKNQTITVTSPITINKGIKIDGTTQNVTISGNNANGIFSVNPPVGKIVVINNLTMTNGTRPGGTSGGAIVAFEGDLQLANDTFSNNVGGLGGGAVAWSPATGGSLTVSNCSFSGNQSNGDGGALWAWSKGGAINITNTAFTNNIADDNGGAVYAKGGPTVTLSVTNNCQFNNNTATDGSGGAIYTPKDNTSVSMVLDSSSFAQNKCQRVGGAVDAPGDSGGNVRVNNCQFANNQVLGSGALNSYVGGAICTTATLTVSGGTFTGNTAATGGGAIYFGVPDGTTRSVSLTNVTFTNNTANCGGAVCDYANLSQGGATLTVSGCLFNENHATSPAPLEERTGGGLALWHITSGTASATFTITNSTFYQNDSGMHGGGIALWRDNTGTGTNTASLTSLTIYQNQASNDGGGLWLKTLDAAILTQVWNSIIADNFIENTPDQGPDVIGLFKSSGYNLIGIAPTDPNQQWAAGDQLGNAVAPLDPGLDLNGLADNGGPTLTIKVLLTSPAYRMGDKNLANTTDQRGFTRRYDLTIPVKVTIGAYDPDASLLVIPPNPGGE